MAGMANPPRRIQQRKKTTGSGTIRIPFLLIPQYANVVLLDTSENGMKNTLLVLFFLLLISFTRESEAYIDPGSGSYVLQLIVASFFAIVFTLKVFWRNIRAFFSGTTAKKHTDTTNSDQS